MSLEPNIGNPTPGPWQVVIDTEQHTVHVRSEALEFVADFRTDDGYLGGSDVANAMLAAAAPDLLKACKLALGYKWPKYQGISHIPETLEIVIARAEGRQS